jgi:hypothetical protein
MTTEAKNLPPPPEGGQSLRQISEDAFYVVNEVVTRRLGHLPIAKVCFAPFRFHCLSDRRFQGDFHLLPAKVQRFVAEKAELMRPRAIYICDGSQHEAEEIIHKLVERGMLTQLKALENWCVDVYACGPYMLARTVTYVVRIRRMWREWNRKRGLSLRTSTRLSHTQRPVSSRKWATGCRKNNSAASSTIAFPAAWPVSHAFTRHWAQ